MVGCCGKIFWVPKHPFTFQDIHKRVPFYGYGLLQVSSWTQSEVQIHGGGLCVYWWFFPQGLPCYDPHLDPVFCSFCDVLTLYFLVPRLDPVIKVKFYITEEYSYGKSSEITFKSTLLTSYFWRRGWSTTADPFGHRWLQAFLSERSLFLRSSTVNHLPLLTPCALQNLHVEQLPVHSNKRIYFFQLWSNVFPVPWIHHWKNLTSWHGSLLENFKNITWIGTVEEVFV